MWSLGVKSPSLLGIAGCSPTARLGTAWGKVSPKSGFFVRLRYRVHQLVSTVSCMMFVSRPICWAPVALLDSSEFVVLLPQIRLEDFGRGQKPENGGVSWCETAASFFSRRR